MPTRKPPRPPSGTDPAGAPKTPDAFQVVDDFTDEKVIESRDASLAQLEKLAALWPGLVQLRDDDRDGNLGKLLAILGPALRKLFALLTAQPGDDAGIRELKKKLAAIFDASVGSEDFGKDPDAFEVGLLVRRVNRIAAEQEVLRKLDELRRRLTDDILNTSEMVVEPGLKAIRLANTIAGTNKEFRSHLAPLANALGEMTKAARAAQAEARAKKAREAAAAAAAGGTGPK